MLRITAADGMGRTVELPQPESLLFWREADAPADLLEAVFFTDVSLPPLAEITVERGGVLWFCGVIDEQNTTLSKQGVQVELVCRSLEAVLLDNEAKPETIAAPSLKRLEERLLTPFGLQLGDGDTDRKPGELVIEKGESGWSVLARFCESFLGVTPRVTPYGVVHCAPADVHDFPLTGVISAQYSELPCKRVTEVWQQSCRGQYDTRYRAEHADGQNPKTLRRRYLSREATRSARDLLRQSEAESRQLSVTCCGAVLPQKEDTASVSIPLLGSFAGWQVQRVRYRRSSEGETTTLVLAPLTGTEG